MGYNMWLSEDSQYTLGRRISTHESRPPAQPDPEPRADTPTVPDRAEMDHIDFLMETLARRLDTN
jgi:hypothetical protein